MTAIGEASANPWLRSQAAALLQGLIHGFAGLSLIIIIWLNILIWPIGSLGYAADSRTGMIMAIASGTPAANAGLQLGDRIVALYDRPWSDVISAWNVLAFVPPTGARIAMTIERDGALRHVSLVHVPPDIGFQEEKGAILLLAGLCWLVGYLLGIVRRNEATSSPLVALFWLAMAGVLGSYLFAAYASIPLRVLLQWSLIAVLMPLATFVHVWFPARIIAPPDSRRAARLLIGWVLGVHVLLLAAIGIWRPALVELMSTFSDIAPIVSLAAFILSGALLFRSYRQASVAHVRRQIRLIALACMIVAFLWTLAFIIPILIHEPILLADQRLKIIAGGIPLAYLVSGIGRDLYRIDRVLMRLSTHMLTIFTLVVGLALVIVGFDVRGSGLLLWAVVLFVVLYRPVQRIAQRVLLSGGQQGQDYRALNATLTHLTTTLDTSELISRIVDGVRLTFNQPSLAFYASHIDGTNEMTLTIQERMPYLPAVIAPGHLTTSLASGRSVISSRSLLQIVGEDVLHADEEQALQAPGVLLWCPIVHRDGYLLGVLLLGMRSDFDPYREQDERELQRLMDASALALTNSAAYDQQRWAEATIRDLYQHLQEVQDATATEIARELHDEIINVNVRLNVQALEQLLTRVYDPVLCDELDLVLESERTVIQTLRLICERLHPTGLDDPFGLAAVLRAQVERARAQWSGECLLCVEGSAHPVNSRLQREAMRITREALVNAIKHADATRIVVELRYPSNSNEPIELTIRDNGRNARTIVPQAGHWGVRNMYESARAVNGSLMIAPERGGGMAVVFRFTGAAANMV